MRTPGAPDFGRVAVFGVGLIGASLGQALRATGLAREVVGVGRRLETLRLARERGAVDRFTTDVAAGFRGARLVCLCAPVGAVLDLLRGGLPCLEAGQVVTDACSTKQQVVAAAAALPPGVSFVGAHPVAGSEKSGPGAAFPGLFRGRVTVLTPVPGTPAPSLALVGDLWRAVGARTVCLDPAAHDRVFALTSHLPHLAAALLAQLAAGLAVPGRADFIGSGFRDATRIAGGDPDLWTDIFETNAANLIAGLDEMTALAAAWRGALAGGDRSALRGLLAGGALAREALVPAEAGGEKNGGGQHDDRGAGGKVNPVGDDQAGQV